jgi:cholesterol oxidase
MEKRMKNKFSRRAFICSSALGAVSSMIPIASSQNNQTRDVKKTSVRTRNKLSNQFTEFPQSSDVVVIGSGYGGAIVASRLAENFNVTLLERGKEYLPGDFPDTFNEVSSTFKSSDNPLGLFDYVLGDDIDVLVGSGLGGTSLINANVVIAANEQEFSSEVWPREIKEASENGELVDYQNKIYEVLKPEVVSPSVHLNKTQNLASTSTHLNDGTEFKMLDLAVNMTRYDDQENEYGVHQKLCSHCGDCVSGCNVGAKNTLDTNYLALAKQRGAKLFVQLEVDYIEKLVTGEYLVSGVRYEEYGTQSSFNIKANTVFIAAGSLGTTGILKRTAIQGNMSFSPILGKNVSGNADLLQVNYNQLVPTNSLGFGTTEAFSSDYLCGPTITSAAIHNPNTEYQILIEDAAIPKALINSAAFAAAIRAPEMSVPKLRRSSRDLVGATEKGALNHSMVYLGIGHDNSDGEIVLDSNDNPKVSWSHIHDDPFSGTISTEIRKHTDVFDGVVVENPRSEWFGGNNFVTVHPLGGCAMGNSASDGVVNHKGQIFKEKGSLIHQGLYVCDGALIPKSVGVNPMLTISILAERIADLYIKENQQLTTERRS